MSNKAAAFRGLVLSFDGECRFKQLPRHDHTLSVNELLDKQDYSFLY